jgi:hypothetical protein
VIFHSDRGSTYTANDFTTLCETFDIAQSMGRVGSCFDNAAAESFFSTLEHEVLSRHHFTTREEARKVVVTWVVDFYNGGDATVVAGCSHPSATRTLSTPKHSGVLHATGGSSALSFARMRGYAALPLLGRVR